MMTDAIPDEERLQARESYQALLARLSRQSVNKRYEAYRDIDWDAPELRIDPDDPRFELGAYDALGGTAWYRAQPPARRSRIGLHRLATFMKVGLQFENVLSRGLLLFSMTRDEQSPEQRYAYHELIEESHHSMMFAEFIRRSGVKTPGMEGRWLAIGERVAGLGASFPELFFVFVLGGEDPIDHAQRMALSDERSLHPLVRRISQIHITEEARHLCFARSFLRQYVPQLSPRRRATLSLVAPAILRVEAELMLAPPRSLIREFEIPRAVVDEAWRKNPAHRASVLASLGKVRTLLVELGLAAGAAGGLWRAIGGAAA